MVTQTMAQLIDTYGPPHATLTDHGLVFTTGWARFKGARGGFEKQLAVHGITQPANATASPDTRRHTARSVKTWSGAAPSRV